MQGYFPTVLVIGILLALIASSGGILVWLAQVPASELTSTQESLIDTADWMIKFATGAFLGIVAGLRLAKGKSILKAT